MRHGSLSQSTPGVQSPGFNLRLRFSSHRLLSQGQDREELAPEELSGMGAPVLQITSPAASLSHPRSCGTVNGSTQAKSHTPEGCSLLRRVRSVAWLQPLAVPVSCVIWSKRPSAGCHRAPFQAKESTKSRRTETLQPTLLHFCKWLRNSEPILAGSADGGVEADLQQTFSCLGLLLWASATVQELVPHEA